MKLVWIIGKGGLLGRALLQEYGATNDVQIYIPPSSIPWHDLDLFISEIQKSCEVFSVLSRPGPWEIFWVAGTASMASTQAELNYENKLFKAFLAALAKSRLNFNDGLVFFASSAGGVYAGSSDAIINEHSIPQPLTPYGKSKLEQEKELLQFARYSNLKGVLIGRISNLFGPSVKIQKNKGLIHQIINSILTNTPISIFVPLDTKRDYLYSLDAAKIIISAVNQLDLEQKEIIRIISAESSISIVELLCLCKKITRRNPRILITRNNLSNIYRRSIQFKSIFSECPINNTQEHLASRIAQTILAQRISSQVTPRQQIG